MQLLACDLTRLSSLIRALENAHTTIEVTAKGARNLLEATRLRSNRTGTRVRFYQASSSEMFGNASESPQTERSPVNPANPYGASKAYAHHLVGVCRGLGLVASSSILDNHESP